MKGKCYLCNQTFSKAGMTKHLRTHLKNDGDTKLFHIMVDGLYEPQYWLHIEIKANAKLKDLDQFLRDLWLECCGHLSAFEIGGVSYHSDYFDFDLDPTAKDMNVPVNKVLNPGMEFYHIYDFGSSTELRLKVLGERKGKAKEKVRILARNNPPEKACGCGEKAKWVCTQCFVDNLGENCYFCEKCAKEHECGEEMLLPVVNSPRSGVCGFEGGKYD
ncbi:IS1096 element passenger TnpR family protein [Thermodesulforhabdus norvegica]|uniref:PRiA4b ORF-3-like protein n=1 Tax=Thermodesulforhabdus norvegica TaxID=39841 RepID=A0A1I4VVX5_9BACT|nr:hypothetical protein [Thermodesulforhabdus norvegica]SFN05355.1 pRiA4b ORF-3-like protein [Thermodesulforhabdus norvegica]